MSTETYFGAEVVDTGPGSAVVLDRKAATAFVTGTAPVGEVHDTPAKRAEFINTTISVTREEDAVAAFGEHVDGYTLPLALKTAFAESKTKGIGEIRICNVYDPDVHASPADVTNTDIIGGFRADGRPYGLSLGFEHYQRFGNFSKIIAAPGFTLMPGVRTALASLSGRTRGRALIDAPLGVTRQQVIEARGPLGDFDFNFSDRRLVGLWPHMEVIDPISGDPVAHPYSATFLGIWLSSIAEHGYHHSPSNRPTVQENSAQQVLTIPGDPTSEPQLLRAAGVITMEERWGNGLHTSGNRSSAYPTDSDLRNFLHVQFIEDMIDEMVIEYLEQLKDRNVTQASIQSTEEAINVKLQEMADPTDPIVYEGRFRFNRKKTTPHSLGNGHSFYHLGYAPVGVNERMTVEREIDLSLMANPLGLAA